MFVLLHLHSVLLLKAGLEWEVWMRVSYTFLNFSLAVSPIPLMLEVLVSHHLAGPSFIVLMACD